MTADVIRADFPFFSFPGAPVYLDSAATAQKPQCVIDRITAFYSGECANIHRGGYPLAAAATRAYEQARAGIAAFIGAGADNVIFTLNATDALNQAAAMLAPRIQAGSNVIATALEHNSALLPFMRICKENGAQLRLIPLGEDGAPQLHLIETLIDPNTAAAVITAGASATGWRAPLDQILPVFAQRGIPTVVDATQRIVHDRIDFSALGCDFLCFSGHKLYGPTGIGVLAMKDAWRTHAPARIGGGTVREATENGYSLHSGVEAFEAGTPPIAQALGLHSAAAYLLAHDPDALFAQENRLALRLEQGLSAISGVHVIPAGEHRLPIVSFTCSDIHAADMAQLLAARGIAVRVGQHCAHIAHRQLGLESTIRASIGIYTHEADVDTLLNAIEHIQQRWRKRHGPRTP